MVKYLDEVEVDLLRHGLDIDDWRLTVNGRRKMSTRRLLLVVDKMLDKLTSAFWTRVLDIDPLSREVYVLTDIYQALQGKPHPIRTRREDEKKRAEMEEKKALIRAYDAQRRGRFAERGIRVRDTPTTK